MINRRDLFKGLIAGIVVAGTAVPAVAKALETRPNWNKLVKRRVINDIEKAMEWAMAESTFEVNDDFTRNHVSEYVSGIARNHKLNKSLYDFCVVCDKTNNTPKVIDANKLICDVYLKFPNEMTFTRINAITERNGTTFEEIVGSLNS